MSGLVNSFLCLYGNCYGIYYVWWLLNQYDITTSDKDRQAAIITGIYLDTLT